MDRQKSSTSIGKSKRRAELRKIFRSINGLAEEVNPATSNLSISIQEETTDDMADIRLNPALLTLFMEKLSEVKI